MSIDLDAYRDLFVEEAREHLDVLSRGIAALGRLQGGAAQGTELEADADVLFRAAHSLKGMAATIGLHHIAAVAHAMEDQLDALRSGRDVALEPFLLAIDALADAVDAVAAHEEHGDLEPVVASLRIAAASAAQPARSVVAVRTAPGSAPALPRSVRVPAARVDRILDRAVALQIEEQRLARLVAQALGTQPSFALTQAISRIQRAARELHADTLALRALPAELATASLPRRAREVAARHGKQAQVAVHGAETRIDRSLLDALRDPLQHLVTNAIVHGIETPEARRAANKKEIGVVEVHIERAGSAVVVTVHDDGGGIDPEQVRARALAAGYVSAQEAERLQGDDVFALLTRPGFTTVGVADEDAGRGVGLDVVAAAVVRVGGSLRITSTPGEGTTVTLVLPPTLELVEVIDCDVNGEPYTVPAEAVRRLIPLPHDVMEAGQVMVRDGGKNARMIRAHALAALLGLRQRSPPYTSEEGDAAPVLRLAERLKPESAQTPEGGPAVRGGGGEADAHPIGILIGEAGIEVCIVVDAVGTARQAVVKPLNVPGGPPPPLSGATLREDGRVAPLIEPRALLHGTTVLR